MSHPHRADQVAVHSLTGKASIPDDILSCLKTASPQGSLSRTQSLALASTFARSLDTILSIEITWCINLLFDFDLSQEARALDNKPRAFSSDASAFVPLAFSLA